MRLKFYLRNKIIWILGIIVFILFKVSSGYFSETVKLYTTSMVRNYSEALIANSIENELMDKIGNSSFLIEKYNSKGYVSYAYLNSYKVNDVRNSIILYMDEAIEEINQHNDLQSIDIPLGYLFGTKYFLTHGIKIPITLDVIGNQDVEVKIDTISKGINTTIIEIYLLVSIDIQVVIPLQKEVVITETKIPLSIEILNNEIPYYLGDFLT